MRTQINSLSSWLRAHRDSIPDSMIESVEFQAAAPKIVLSFPTEEELARFGSTILPDASVLKLDDRVAFGIYQTAYQALTNFRKRPINVFLVVKQQPSIPAQRAFTD